MALTLPCLFPRKKGRPDVWNGPFESLRRWGRLDCFPIHSGGQRRQGLP